MIIKGTLPKNVKGTYFRNGPGFKIFQEHWWDRDGHILSVGFNHGKVLVKNKPVYTKQSKEEKAANKPLYNRIFTAGKWEYLSFKNPANTNIFFWKDKLLATWEKGSPYVIDPHSLDTLGESDLDGLLSPRLLGSHIKTVNGVKIAFSTCLHYNGCKVAIYEDNSKERKDFVLPGVIVPWVHDIQVTPNYYIIPVSGLIWKSLDIATLINHKTSFANSIVKDPNGHLGIYVVPRWTQNPEIRLFKAKKNSFVYHTINAYETNDGNNIVFDAITWNNFVYELKDLLKENRSWTRYKIDLSSTTNDVSAIETPLENIEFPQIHGSVSGHRYSEFVAVGASGEIIKVNFEEHRKSPTDMNIFVDIWKPEGDGVAGEPCYISKDLILSTITTHKNTRIVILKTDDDFKNGPICTIDLPYYLPMGLHGTFVSDYF